MRSGEVLFCFCFLAHIFQASFANYARGKPQVISTDEAEVVYETTAAAESVCRAANRSSSSLLRFPERNDRDVPKQKKREKTSPHQRERKKRELERERKVEYKQKVQQTFIIGFFFYFLFTLAIGQAAQQK